MLILYTYPMIDIILEKLKLYNDDEKFKFEPIKHRYTYDGEYFTPVTQFISKFHEKFDEDFWSKSKAEEFDKTQEEILKDWKDLNDRANEIGTATHDWIEKYFKKIYQELPTDIDIINRINKFNVAYSKFLFKLTPVIFEQMVFSKKWKIAGTMDSIFLYNNKIIVLDWKTNGDFKDNDHPKGKYQKLLPPFEDFYKNHLNEYSIQVSLYALILKECGIDVDCGYLLHIGPDDEARIYKCVNMIPFLEKYLEETYTT